MGNSEVGHTHIGAGRIVKQSLSRINEAIESGEFSRNEGLEAFVSAFKAKEKQGVVHVAGLVSSGGVHGSKEHVLETLKFFHGKGLQVKLHAFLDGRDTPPRAAIEELPRFLEDCEKAELGENILASVVGRYYAMDRDLRWERTKIAFRAMQLGEEMLDEVWKIGKGREKLKDALEESYERNEGDEFVRPHVCGGYKGFAEGDALFFTNFRNDRMLQLAMYSAADILATSRDSHHLVEEHPLPNPLGSMTPLEKRKAFFYEAFKEEPIDHGLGACLSKAGLKQLRIAETEKVMHVTYFFDGGYYEAFKGEERIFAHSPRVATYDQEPEMSAREVTDIFHKNFTEQNFSLFVLNYANPDMVGHTGNLEATKEAIAAVDACLGILDSAIKNSSKKVGLMIFADHGNAEQMLDAKGGPHTMHTTNPVPLVVVGSPSARLNKDSFTLSEGSLIDIAPTALHLLGLEQPAVMTGRSLLKEKK